MAQPLSQETLTQELAPPSHSDARPALQQSFQLDPLAPDIRNNPLLKHIPASVIKQAWFTMAHLVLEEGSKVLNIRCQHGMLTYAMAALNPNIEFIGIDRNKDTIQQVEASFKLPNLTFYSGDIQENFVPKASLDAIINSYSLHEIYSENNCSEFAVTRFLERQLELLKDKGVLYMHGHVMPSSNPYVLMEFPEDRAQGESIEQISEIELLQRYAEQARPRSDDSYRGFYLEEMPARFPKTKLFRLPLKWAREFLLRKDKRDRWSAELPKEYYFFTRKDFYRTFRNLGARVLYSAPHWNEEYIEKNIRKKVRLFEEDGTLLAMPETSYVVLAQKTPERTSLTLQERKPCNKETPHLRITAMRNELEGSIQDIVSRDMHITEILPYRVTSKGKLHVFIHEGIPRALSNTVPRKGPNIDGKKWSGHMTEAMAVPEEIFTTIEETSVRDTMKFMNKYMGLKPEIGALFENGPGFYPAPDYIDEHISTRFLKVQKPTEDIIPKAVLEDADGFSTRGRIREIDAQQILNAISVGAIPSSHLEVQILALYEKLQLSYQAWAQTPLTLETEEEIEPTKLQDIISKLADEDNRYKESKGTAGQIKTLQSVFVDEGQDHGGVTGLASRDLDFVLQEEGSMNTAIVIPLAKKLNGEVMAGIVEQYLPIPQRYKGNGYMISCPSFPLPLDVDNFDKAKQFIADKFGVPVECVARLGESFFSHIGVTPQRIYPFAITPKKVSGWRADGRVHGVTQYTPLYRLYRLLYLDNYYSFMKAVAMCYQAALGQDSDLSAEVSFSQSHAERKEAFVGMTNLEYSEGVQKTEPQNEPIPEPSNDA